MKSKLEWKCVDIDNMKYAHALDLQRRLVEAKKSNQLNEDFLFLLEHPSVFTVGRNGGFENLIVPEEYLEAQGIEVVHIERGGDITYHGPGQLIAYPIIDLRANKLSVSQFVFNLEEVMLRLCLEWGLKANRDNRNHGIWRGDKKLGSVGVAIRKGITFHGFALNVCNSLDPFTWINPCGLQGVKMTSIQAELASVVDEISMDNIRQKCKEIFSHCFEAKLNEVEFEMISNQIKNWG